METLTLNAGTPASAVHESAAHEPEVYDIVASRLLSGGDSAHVTWHRLSNGLEVVCKQADQAGMLEAEALGLQALSETGWGRVPKVLSCEPGQLVLEYLVPAIPSDADWEACGDALAGLHGCMRPAFGGDADNWIGGMPQPNPQTLDGFEFFAEHRLLFQARQARDAGLLSSAIVQRIDRLSHRLDQWLDPQPAVQLHGDLWSGNFHPTEDGVAWVDPAVYWGWAETDLAMTLLFGRQPIAFYKAYEQKRPQVQGWEERAPLYNLYHLLNHLNLFGKVYHGGIVSTLDHYVS